MSSIEESAREPSRVPGCTAPPPEGKEARLSHVDALHSLTSCPYIVVEPGKLWIGSIVIDCKRFDEMIAFWKAALGYELRRPSSEDWALLYDPNGAGPNIAFQKDPDGPGEIYWFHFDLYSSDPEGEVKRLQQLGAMMRQPTQKGLDYVTLADPDGNPFDVVEARGFKFGQRVI